MENLNFGELLRNDCHKNTYTRTQAPHRFNKLNENEQKVIS